MDKITSRLAIRQEYAKQFANEMEGKTDAEIENLMNYECALWKMQIWEVIESKEKDEEGF